MVGCWDIYKFRNDIHVAAMRVDLFLFLISGHVYRIWVWCLFGELGVSASFLYSMLHAYYHFIFLDLVHYLHSQFVDIILTV